MDLKRFGRIGVLMGGYSSERDISLKSGKAVTEALQESGCDVVAVDIKEQDEKKILSALQESHIDVAFIALHGQLGEDGRIQSILEQANIPYTGPGVKASALAFDKIKTQTLLKDRSILIAPHMILNKGEYDAASLVEKNLGLPVVVKPPREGSSIGVTLVKEAKDLPAALDLAWQYAPDILIEKFIKGRELTVGIVGQEALPIVEISYTDEFFNFSAKYQTKTTNYIVPAPLSTCVSQDIRTTALAVHHILGCEDMSRIDFILGTDGRAYVLEVNTIPGFTSSSLLPKAALCNGISFNQLCLKLVDLAYGKKKANQDTCTRR
jgi:D-alanine-D-alanine ligase